MRLYSFEGMLKPIAPFDFSKSLEFLADFGPTRNEQEIKSGTFTKAVQAKGKTVAFEVFDKGTIEQPKLEFTAYSKAKFTYEVKELVADRISFFLSLQDNLKEFYEIAKKDEYIQPAIKKFYGHKQVKFLTPFEIACWAILAQRIPMAVARKMKENIIKKLGGKIIVKGIEYNSFPEPSDLQLHTLSCRSWCQIKEKQSIYQEWQRHFARLMRNGLEKRLMMRFMIG